jgi:MoaD family protein
LRILVRFFTILREITGKKEETLQFSKDEEVTLNRVLKRLSEKYGKAFDEYIYDHRTREVKGFLQFLVNGRSVSSSEGFEAELSDGDILAIVPPVSGG